MTLPLDHRFRTRALVLAAASLFGAAASAETLVGLTTSNALTRFDSATPGQAAVPVPITGLMTGDERIIGIDTRPSTGQLFGLSNTNQLYTLNVSTGAASFVALLMADPTDATAPYTTVMGGSLGIDFNPVPDSAAAQPASLRVMTQTGQNLRINVNGANAGKTLTDGDLNGATNRLDAVAYINNDINPATGTALFGIDTQSDTLYSLVANAGTATAVGSLGLNATGMAGFDVSGASGIAYASFGSGGAGQSGLSTIDLLTGQASFVGAFGMDGDPRQSLPMADISVLAVPEPGTYALMLAGLGAVGWVARRRLPAKALA